MDGGESSRSDAQGARSIVVDARKSLASQASEQVDGAAAPPEAALVVADETTPKAVVIEAVENALHAFGVGRLDLAFEHLRDLLAKLRGG